jgi:hypothetical protein
MKLVGLGATCGAIARFATPKAFGAGTLRLVTTRGEAFCMVALITCPEALWMPGKIAAIKQSKENWICFISCSAN